MVPGSGRSPWRREWLPTPVFLPGESHGQRSLAGYSPRVTESLAQLSDLHFYTADSNVETATQAARIEEIRHQQKITRIL